QPSSPSRDAAFDNVLAGRAVIVTGGSRGLGAAVAQALGEAGARVVLADLALDRATDCAARLAGEGLDVQALPLDVGDEAQVRELFVRVGERLGAVDVLVNNAAIDITTPISELSGADWERVVRTNLTGPFLMAKYAAQ